MHEELNKYLASARESILPPADQSEAVLKDHKMLLDTAETTAAALWKPSLTMGTMKLHVTTFVNFGLEALRTPDMKEAIKVCFRINGFFGQMRNVAYYDTLVTSLAVNPIPMDAFEGLEEDD
jgi:hypothetical protein